MNLPAMNSQEVRIKVRELAPGDVDRVVEIAAQSSGAAMWTKEMVCNAERNGEKAWVAERESRIAGFVVVRAVANEAEVLNLAVEPAARRKGVGKRLLHRALTELTAAGVYHVFLEVRESNAGAVAFYRGLGFVETGKRLEYYRDPDEAALCMKIKLLDQDEVPT